MSGGRLRAFFPPTSAKKERDEELALFRELFKREREKNMNLLDSVSTDLDALDGNSVFKNSSGKKSEARGNENEKNDYDWLKTPPATPLFQSLEMDVGQVNNPSMINHKDLTIIPAVLRPSRFSEKMEEPKPVSSIILTSAEGSRPESPDLLLPPRSAVSTPLATPRFGFKKETLLAQPIQPSGRFLRRKDEQRGRAKSPGSLSVASTAASSRPESPEVKPPSIRRAPNIVRGKEDPKALDRTVKRFGKEGPPARPIPEPRLPTRQVQPKSDALKAKLPSSSSASSRPDATKPSPEPKPNGRINPRMVQSRLPAVLPDFPAEAPPNLITTTRTARGLMEQRRPPAGVAKDDRRQLGTKEPKGNSLAERTANTKKVLTAKDERASKSRGIH